MSTLLIVVGFSAVLFKSKIPRYFVSNDKNVVAIYNKYCPNKIKLNYKNTDYSEDFFATNSQLNIDELSKKLMNGEYKDNQVSSALRVFGGKLMSDKFKFDDGYSIIKCSAEKYYNMSAIYLLARFYDYGTDSVQKAYPQMVIINKIKPDKKLEYFWIVSLFYLEFIEQTNLLTLDTTLGWNSWAMLDNLQMGGELSDKDLIDIENQSRNFISKKYPKELNNDYRLYNHKL